MSPNDEVFDDTICGQCGATLPNDITPGSVQDDGFCSAACANMKRLMTAPLGEVIDLKPGHTPGLEGCRIGDGNGGEILMLRPKFVPPGTVS